jgi:hypothetical protein
VTGVPDTSPKRLNQLLARRRGHPQDDINSARDLFSLVLGLCGVLIGAATALVLSWLDAAALTTVAQLATAASGAISATLLFELLTALVRRRGLAALLLRATLLGLNGVFFVAELLLLLVLKSAG